MHQSPLKKDFYSRGGGPACTLVLVVAMNARLTGLLGRFLRDRP